MGKSIGTAAALALGIAAAASVSLGEPSAAWAVACVSGHNTLGPTGASPLPCTFDSGVLSFDSATTPGGAPVDFSGGGGGGHHTLIEFIGSSITVTADIALGKAPYEATDVPTTGIATGTNSVSVVIMISALGGALIDDISLTLLNPSVVGTGSMDFSFGPLTGLNQSNTFAETTFPPASSITETLSGTLSTGCGVPSATCTGNAIIDGFTLGFSLVPEPSSLAALSSGLAALWLIRRRRRPR